MGSQYLQRFICRIPLFSKAPVIGSDVQQRLGRAVLDVVRAERAFEDVVARSAEVFHRLVGEATDKKARHRLLEAKRALRAGAPDVRQLPAQAQEAIIPVRDALTKLRQSQDSLTQAYGDATEHELAVLSERVAAPEVASALIAVGSAIADLSSRPSAERLDQLRRSSHLRGAVHLYLTRGALKSSPIGLFVGMALGQVTAQTELRLDDERRVELVPDLLHLRRWSQRLQHALRGNDTLELALTPILEEHEDRLVFVSVGLDRVQYKREIARNGAVDALLRLLQSRDAARWSEVRSALRDALNSPSEEEGDGQAPAEGEDEGFTDAEIDRFIASLVDSGLLDAALPLPMFERRPLRALAAYLGRIEGDVARRARRRLLRTAGLLEGLEHRVSKGDAVAALRRARSRLPRALPSGEETGDARSLFVDTALPTSVVQIAEPDAAQLLHSVQQLSRLHAAFYRQPESNARPSPMSARTLLGTEKRISLVELHHRARAASGLSSMQSAEDMARKMARAGNHFRTPSTVDGRRAFAAFVDRARQCEAVGTRELVLDEGAVAELVGPSPPGVPPSWFTMMAMVGRQPDGRLLFTFEGFSSPAFYIAGRFALLLQEDPGGAEYLDEWRRGYARAKSRLDGASPLSWYFAPPLANLTAGRQPAVLDAYVHVLGPRALGGPRRLPISALDVVADESDAVRVHVVHRETGERVVPFLHGIQDPRAFPAAGSVSLSQLAGRLDPPGWAAALEAADESGRERRWPRVRIGNLVVNRECWQPASARVAAWRSLPDEAFFQQVNRWMSEAGAGDVVWAFGLDDSKPLPVVRLSPASMAELRRRIIAAEAAVALRFFECSPAPSEFPVEGSNGSHPLEILMSMELSPAGGGA